MVLFALFERTSNTIIHDFHKRGNQEFQDVVSNLRDIRGTASFCVRMGIKQHCTMTIQKPESREVCPSVSSEAMTAKYYSREWGKHVGADNLWEERGQEQVSMNRCK